MTVTVTIHLEHNNNEVTVTMFEMAMGGKPETEDKIRELTDKAKTKAIATLIG